MSTEDSPAAQLAVVLAQLVPEEFVPQAHGEGVDLMIGSAAFHFAVGPGRYDEYRYVRVGDKLDEFVRNTDRDERCYVQFAGEQCSRKNDHPGQHVVQGRRSFKVLAVAPNENEPAVATGGASGGSDPLAHITKGDTLTADQWPGTDNPLCREMCEINGHESFGLMCTREPDHPGQHIGTYSNGDVVGVWTVEPVTPKRMSMADWEAVEPGQKPDPTNGISEAVWCKADVSGYVCTREGGHLGKHVAGNGRGVVDVRERTAVDA